MPRAAGGRGAALHRRREAARGRIAAEDLGRARKATTPPDNGDLAIEGFQSFIKTSPQSPQADDAAGDDLQRRTLIDGKYQTGRRRVRHGDQNYPNGSQTAQAYYRKGLALKDLKQTDRAREALDYVIKTFPEQRRGDPRARRTRKNPDRSADDGHRTM